MAIGDAHVFLGFLTPVLTQLFFPKPPTTFLTCFCRGERRKYAGKKVQPGIELATTGHVSNTLTTEPPGRGLRYCNILASSTYNYCCKPLKVSLYEDFFPALASVLVKILIHVHFSLVPTVFQLSISNMHYFHKSENFSDCSSNTKVDRRN